MPDLRIELKGADELSKKLGRIMKQLPKESESAMLESVLYVHSVMPPYPPWPERRTGTLGRTVTTLAGRDPESLSRVEPLASGNGVQGFIGTRLNYAQRVIGQRQGRAWAGRWWRLVDVAVGAKDGILKIWQKKIKEIIRK